MCITRSEFPGLHTSDLTGYSSRIFPKLPFNLIIYWNDICHLENAIVVTLDKEHKVSQPQWRALDLECSDRECLCSLHMEQGLSLSQHLHWAPVSILSRSGFYFWILSDHMMDHVFTSQSQPLLVPNLSSGDRAPRWAISLVNTLKQDSGIGSSSQEQETKVKCMLCSTALCRKDRHWERKWISSMSGYTKLLVNLKIFFK